MLSSGGRRIHQTPNAASDGTATSTRHQAPGRVRHTKPNTQIPNRNASAWQQNSATSRTATNTVQPQCAPARIDRNAAHTTNSSTGTDIVNPTNPYTAFKWYSNRNASSVYQASPPTSRISSSTANGSRVMYIR
ncbi:MAG: hypothetical protein FJW39_26040 [Acidobacteria bacterium]|nr:hypothetical protein [Acidobacteriota bacterium]